MLINFPDIGFSNPQNINQPDRFYQNIKESVLKHVQLIDQENGTATPGVSSMQNLPKNQAKSQAQMEGSSSITSIGMTAGMQNTNQYSLPDVKAQQVSAVEFAQGQTQLNVFSYNVRDLYLEMRNKMITQSS